jgi:general secretion pathway protein E
MTPDSFAAAIAKARSQTACVNGNLWLALLSATSQDPTKLKRQLWESEGIDTLNSGKIWALRQPSMDLPPGLLWLINDTGESRLLCEDPWSDPALSALSRLSDGQLALALAQPGQLQALQAQAMSAHQPNQVNLDVDNDIVGFVQTAIQQASAEGASDIHFESSRLGIAIKYRLDGVMVAGPRLDQPQQAEQVISRIKVLAELDITERRKPQDGRFRWTGPEGMSLDLRVSIMPSVFGEDAVLRLLDKAQLRDAVQKISLDTLGFVEHQSDAIRELAARPHGMLLVTGPTGSGKTTTLYATLSEVNSGIEKIITIEDPVEYELAGVLQIPVNERKGLTFATGLRSILRHDPDKILIGEIRDSETAEIAVQAALTGHVVFTTVHANSVFDVLGRFQHFAIDPFAFASSLNGIVVQRLLRKLCPHCASSRQLTTQEQTLISRAGLTVPERIACATGCSHCRNTGYRGRFVIAQVHLIDDALRELILSQRSIMQIKSEVEKQQGQSLLAQGIAHSVAGQTSLEEVIRVVGWN